MPLPPARLLAASLLVIGAAAAAFASSLETRAGASGPGTYAHYVLPTTPGGATDIEHAVVWVHEPGADETHGNAVFASTQMWHAAGPGGYLGTQRWLDTATGKMVSKAIFSMWDASADVMTSWVGPNCERFGGEGTGGVGVGFVVVLSYEVVLLVQPFSQIAHLAHKPILVGECIVARVRHRGEGDPLHEPDVVVELFAPVDHRLVPFPCQPVDVSRLGGDVGIEPFGSS